MAPIEWGEVIWEPDDDPETEAAYNRLFDYLDWCGRQADRFELWTSGGSE
jgi:hypothetical protein